MPDPWFDAVGLAFAAHVEEVEAARQRYLDSRDSVVRALAKQLTTAIAAAGLKVIATDIGEERETLTSYAWNTIKGAYRDAHDGDGEANISFALAHGSYFGNQQNHELGIYPYLSFKMGERRFRAMQLETMFREAVPGAWACYHSGGHTFIVLPPVLRSSPDFNFAAACARLLGLVKAFPAADDWVAKQYRRVKEQ